MILSRLYSVTIRVMICLIAILTLGVNCWNRGIASSRVESAINKDKVEKDSCVKGWDFWIVDIDAIGQRLFLRPLLFKRFKPESFTAKRVIFYLPEKICSEKKIVSNLSDGVSINCVTQYLQKMMDSFIEADCRRKGIISFDISIPMVIQSQYILNGADSENVRMYNLNYVFSYTQEIGIMIRSIDVKFIRELSSGSSLKQAIQNEWRRQQLIFNGDNSFYGPVETKGQN